LAGGHADDYQAVFVFGVLIVWQGRAQRVGEDSRGFVERDAVLLQIACGFGWIELEAQLGIGHSLAIDAILARRAMVCGGWRKAGQSLRASRCTTVLRQNGRVFGPWFYGTRSTALRAGSEAVRFRFGVSVERG